jgi:tetratricopeptide (TPR) repeat protein
VKRLIAGVFFLAGLAAAGLLAKQAVERDREYRRFILQGDQALEGGQPFAAIEDYSGAIALKPGSMLAYLKRGEAHQKRGDTAETLSAALRDLRAAAERDPGSTRTLEKLGDVNFQLRRFANAAESYEAYVRIDDRSAAIFYKLALASREDGRLNRAIVALRQAVVLNPTFHEAHYVLGLCYKDREQIEEARGAFDRAVAVSPAFIPAREELADLYRLQERSREEIDQLDALYALDPAKAERLIAVALAYLRAGDRELAVTTLGKAAERFKDHPSVHLALGRVWLTAAEMSLDPADMREALEALGPVASQSTATSETLGLYGRALALSGQYGRASVALKQAAQRFPIDPEVLLHYAAVAERLGQLPTARDALLQYSALIDDERDDAAHAERIAALTHRIQAR